MPRMEEINQLKQLLVEGRDAYDFFKVLLKQLKITDIQIQNFGGVQELRQFLDALVITPNFDSVQSVGIVRDVEQNAPAAFYSVQNTLKALNLAHPDDANLDIPNEVGKFTTRERLKRTGVYLLPDLNATSGMLEDLCLKMLDSDAAIGCVEQYFQCLNSQGIQPPKNFAKAKMTAFLASKPKLKQRVGYAMNQDYWNWEHPCLDPLKEFIRAL